MYYEWPALLNLPVCENALNLAEIEEDGAKGMMEDKKRKKCHNSAWSAAEVSILSKQREDK